MTKLPKTPRYEIVKRTEGGHLLILEERAADAARADAWLKLAVIEASDAGLSLRQIAETTRYSHEWVRKYTAGVEALKRQEALS